MALQLPSFTPYSTPNINQQNKEGAEANKALGQIRLKRLLDTASTDALDVETGEIDPVKFRKSLINSGYKFSAEELNAANKHLLETQKQAAELMEANAQIASVGADPSRQMQGKYVPGTPSTFKSVGKDASGFEYDIQGKPLNGPKSQTIPQSKSPVQEKQSVLQNIPVAPLNIQNPQEKTVPQDQAIPEVKKTASQEWIDRMKKWGPNGSGKESEAVKLVQQQVGMAPKDQDGTVGKKTQAAIEKYLTAYPNAEIQAQGKNISVGKKMLASNPIPKEVVISENMASSQKQGTNLGQTTLVPKRATNMETARLQEPVVDNEQVIVPPTEATDTRSKDWMLRMMNSQKDNQYGIGGMNHTQDLESFSAENNKMVIGENTPPLLKTMYTRTVQTLFPNINPNDVEEINFHLNKIFENKIQKFIGPEPVMAPKSPDAKGRFEARAEYAKDLQKYKAERKAAIGKAQAEMQKDFQDMSSNDIARQDNARKRVENEMKMSEYNKELEGIDNGVNALTRISINGRFDPTTFKDSKEVGDFANKYGAYVHIMKMKPPKNNVELIGFISQLAKLEKFPESEKIYSILMQGVTPGAFETFKQSLASGDLRNVPGQVLASVLGNADEALRSVKKGGLAGFLSEVKSHIGEGELNYAGLNSADREWGDKSVSPAELEFRMKKDVDSKKSGDVDSKKSGDVKPKAKSSAKTKKELSDDRITKLRAKYGIGVENE